MSLFSSAAPVFLSLILGPAGVERWRPMELEVRPGPEANLDEVKSAALGYVGRPYVMGGVGDPGFDCSGFVCRVFAESGVAIPRVSRDQAKAGAPSDPANPRAGDLLFFAEEGEPISHVGLFLGNGEMVHASSGQGEVVVADLSAAWFKERLVAARTVLTSSATGAPPAPAIESVELVEHSGEFGLPPMLRLPNRRPAPSYGPAVVDDRATGVRLRALGLTEGRKLGLTIVPELFLHVPSIALFALVAVPIRFAPGVDPTVGPIEGPADVLRFVRTLSLGLRGADLELRFSRLGDVTLLDGYVVDRYVASGRAEGVPGLSVGRAPLSFFGAYRDASVAVQVLVDDVARPGMAGAGARVSAADGILDIGLGLTTDQRAESVTGRRALNAVEAQATVHALDSEAWSLGAVAQGALLQALGEAGMGGELRAFAEWRFARRTEGSVGLTARAGVAGPSFASGFFGPTYAAFGPRHLAYLEEVQGRFEAGAGAKLELRRFVLGFAFSDAMGAGRHGMDRRLDVLAELTKLSLGGTRFLDLRAVYSARDVFRRRPYVHVLHGGGRLRLRSWLALELYAEIGQATEAGAGVSLAWLL